MYKHSCGSLNMNDMKTIEVVAAVIIRSGYVFATKRGYGPWKGWWEFPGGKIEPGEGQPEALKREIMEELGVEIEVGELLDTVEWDYPDFHLKMYCFRCSVMAGSICLNEHDDAAWLDADNIRSVKWLPADEGVLEMIRMLL